ncbi:hypothetical protein F0P96_00115 [Hymenobacter busanensis]|uniref:Uncharacterized protein n=1 Tax=Hymenobacter busanensis TaxID=2607656 RepID=A0AA88K0H6_9BACT|nr:hypothetical protein F0P96_00115 [Hymenobacter busanensis]
MASKILSFICHVPGVIPGSYPSVPTTSSSGVQPRTTTADRHSDGSKGHFTAIYENEKFVRFKYIANAVS